MRWMEPFVSTPLRVSPLVPGGGDERASQHTVISKPANPTRYALNRTPYRGTSLIRNSALVGLYSRSTLRVLWWT